MRIYRGLEFITDSGLVAGADQYVSIPENGVAGNFNAFELQGRPDSLGAPVGRISMVAHDTGVDVEVFRIEVKNEPISPHPYTWSNDTGIMTTWHKNGFGWRRGLQTDGNTLFFGYNPNDTNAASGSILNPNSSGYYSLSALRSVLSGAACTDLVAAGYIDACPAMDSVLIGTVDNTDWVNIATNTGPTAAGVLINPAGPLAITGVTKHPSNHEVGFTDTSNPKTGTVDTRIWRDNAVGAIGFGGATQPHGLNIYETTSAAADAVPSTGANFSRVRISNNAGGPVQILSDAAGTGTTRAMQLGTGGSNAALTFLTNGSARWAIDGAAGSFLPQSAALDLGSAAAEVRRTFLSEYVQFAEMAAGPAGQTNKAILFAGDNGSGKTMLWVQFPTGSPVQIAIEA